MCVSLRNRAAELKKKDIGGKFPTKSLMCGALAGTQTE